MNGHYRQERRVQSGGSVKGSMPKLAYHGYCAAIQMC